MVVSVEFTRLRAASVVLNAWVSLVSVVLSPGTVVVSPVADAFATGV